MREPVNKMSAGRHALAHHPYRCDWRDAAGAVRHQEIGGGTTGAEPKERLRRTALSTTSRTRFASALPKAWNPLACGRSQPLRGRVIVGTSSSYRQTRAAPGHGRRLAPRLRSPLPPL